MAHLLADFSSLAAENGSICLSVTLEPLHELCSCSVCLLGLFFVLPPFDFLLNAIFVEAATRTNASNESPKSCSEPLSTVDSSTTIFSDLYCLLSAPRKSCHHPPDARQQPRYSPEATVSATTILELGKWKVDALYNLLVHDTRLSVLHCLLREFWGLQASSCLEVKDGFASFLESPFTTLWRLDYAHTTATTQ